MCLTLSDKHEQELREVRKRGPFIAYKVVLVHGTKLVGAYRIRTEFRLQRVMRRHGYLPHLVRGKKYPAGFHVFATKSQADMLFSSNYYRTIRCLVWDIAAVGAWCRSKSYIARKMVLMA